MNRSDESPITGLLGVLADQAGWVRWALIVIAATSLTVITWSFPVGRALQWAQGKAADLGSGGPVFFAVAYIAAALLFVPGAALTITAGALFGVVRGTVIVSVSSTLAAAGAFLIARYAARGSIERLARRYRRFAAIDRAIGEGGWKMVALLRLSPAVPYSAGNYLFGLTPVRFWPYVLASWVAMLPGTLLYVYLGHAGASGVSAVSGRSDRTTGEWVLLGVGLIATAAVTVYLSMLARRRLRELPDDIEGERRAMAEAENLPFEEFASRQKRVAWKLAAGLLLTLALAATAFVAASNRHKLAALFGPPAVQMKEAYGQDIGGPTFDHKAFDALLRKHVSDGGWVDYHGLEADAAALDDYIASLASAPFEELSRHEKLALLLNAYNAFTLQLILEYWAGGKLQSIKDVPEAKRWNDKRWKIGPNTWSLDQIEHEQIRPRFREPRIHFALVCAAIGCPPLRAEAYAGARLEEQLAEQAAYVHTHDRWLRFDEGGGVVRLTRLYDWYGDDFKQVAGSVLAYAAKHSEALRRALDAGKKPKIEWLEYDWRLNSQQNRIK